MNKYLIILESVGLTFWLIIMVLGAKFPEISASSYSTFDAALDAFLTFMVARYIWIAPR